MYVKRTWLLVIIALIISSNGKAQWNQTLIDLEVNKAYDLHQFKTVAIAEVVDHRERKTDHTRSLYDELATSLIELGGIQLADRDKTKLILKEFEFQYSSLVSESTMREMGNFIGTGVILLARLQTDNFSDQVIREDRFGTVNGCNHHKVRYATQDLILNIKLIDVTRAKIIYSENIESTYTLKTPRNGCSTPPRIDKHKLFNKSLQQLGTKFSNLFRKHKLSRTIVFQKNGRINSELKDAITYFNINEFEKGYARLEKIVSSSKEKAKSAALYNLALIQYYTGIEEDAYKNAQQAYILDPKNADCLKIINALK